MRLIEIKTEHKDVYAINGVIAEGEELTINNIDVFEDVDASKNGVVQRYFGESFAGNRLDAYDLLMAAIAAYFNDDTSIEFLYVCSEIKALKESQTYTYSVGNRKIPDYVITPSGRLHQLSAIIQEADGLGNAYYCGLIDGEKCAESIVMTRFDGTVATDIEAFATGALLQAATNDDLFIYVDEPTKEWLQDHRESEGLSPELKIA